jgi:hypothetical protein
VSASLRGEAGTTGGGLAGPGPVTCPCLITGPTPGCTHTVPSPAQRTAQCCYLPQRTLPPPGRPLAGLPLEAPFAPLHPHASARAHVCACAQTYDGTSRCRAHARMHASECARARAQAGALQAPGQAAGPGPKPESRRNGRESWSSQLRVGGSLVTSPADSYTRMLDSYTRAHTHATARDTPNLN